MIRLILISFFYLFLQNASAQQDTVTMPASEKFRRSEAYQQKWGKNYRDVWSAPVTFRRVDLDTFRGGLVPYQEGGGRQSKTLRLRDKSGREYVLRSVEKSFSSILQGEAKGSFVENILNDQASSGHPYAAPVVASLAEAAGILHTWPEIIFIPKQPALKEFNESFGDRLFLFEERPDEDWSIAPHLSNSKNIVGTEKLFEKLEESSTNTVDQELYVRSRLFDMLIGDWSRHEDQWRWAEKKTGKDVVYLPVPRDRDQAFSLFEGKFLRPALAVAGASHIESFDGDIKDIADYNFPARYLDRRFTTSVPRETWISIARDLKNRLTDDVIRFALQRMPDTVYTLTGDQVAHHLFSRRNNLEKFAGDYYEVLSREIDIPLSNDDEKITVSSSEGITVVEIMNGQKQVFRREFVPSETSAIRIYGIGGADQYEVKGKPSVPVIFVGKDKEQNYRFDWYQADKFSVLPYPFYSFEDKVHIALRISKVSYAWNKEPYKSMHKLVPRYSISQGAPSVTYENHFPMLFGKWGIETFANFDRELWTNFYGLGNESIFQKEDKDYTRMRTREISVMSGLTRVIGNRHKVFIMPFFRSTDLMHDTARFIAHTMAPAPQLYNAKQYVGGMARYIYQNTNDSVLPEKGFTMDLSAIPAFGIGKTNNDFSRFTGELNGYIPLAGDFGIHVRSGAATLTGDPLFFQLNRVGGTDNLRGFERDRFHGRTVQYNQFNLRWINDVTGRIYSGKFGIFGFADAGRAWIDDEESDKWHMGYGLGLLLSPFNKIAATVAYGFSKDGPNLHFDLIRPIGN